MRRRKVLLPMRRSLGRDGERGRGGRRGGLEIPDWERAGGLGRLTAGVKQLRKRKAFNWCEEATG